MTNLKTCAVCNELPAMAELILCGRCSDARNRADEAACRAASESSYEAARARMAGIGTAAFVPTSDTERRMHRAARSKVNFGYGGH